ncbi:MAG: hypothetical protein RSD88_01975 [Anaerovoracaceae bacterium]
MKKIILPSVLIILIFVLTACSVNKTVYGEISSITNSKIYIKTGYYSNTPTDSSNESSNEKNSENFLDEDRPPQGKFISDGKTESYTLSKNINTANLVNGALVNITLKADKVSEIEIINQAGRKSIKSDNNSIKLAGVYTIDDEEVLSEGESYKSTQKDQNTVLVENAGKLTMTDASLTKSGKTSSNDKSNFYGLNGICTITTQSTADFMDSKLTSSSKGCSGLIATGTGARINANNVTINTSGDSSLGLNSTYNGTIVANKMKIKTLGDYAPSVATAQTHGIIHLSNSTLKSTGISSPCLYSTGEIVATNVTGNTSASEIAVVEGKHNITLKNCRLTGSGDNGIVLYTPASSEEEEGTASFTSRGSTLKTKSIGPMFYVTNTPAKITLQNSNLIYTSGILAKASGDLALKGIHQKLKGDITCDNISTIDLRLTNDTTYKGAVNTKNSGGKVTVSLDKSSSWTVTNDSYVTTITNEATSCRNIKTNGSNVYYDPDNNANNWLKDNTITLLGGGKLLPVN